MGISTGSAFRSQFLNLSQYNFHSQATTTSSVTTGGEDTTQLGPFWPIYNMTTLVMQCPNMQEIYRKASSNLPWGNGQEVVWMNVASPHPSTPAVITAGTQLNFACKNTGFIPMQAVSSNLPNLTDITRDWTGYVPLVKNKMRAKFKLHMLATLLDAADFTSIGSYWMRIMLGPNSDNYWFSGFKTVSYQGSGTVDATVGVMPQSISNGVVTGGWSNLTPFNTINIQQSWSPHWCSSYELVDDTWMSDWIPQNTQPDWRYSDTHQPDDGSTTGYRVEHRRYHHIVWSQHWHHHSTPSQHTCCRVVSRRKRALVQV